MTHSHLHRNTTHQCGTLCFGTDPPHVGARPVLPDPRRREPVRRGRVVLPVVGGGEPGPDHRRPGPAGRRPHQGARTCSRAWRLHSESAHRSATSASPFRTSTRAVRFYWDVFGCPLVGVADTPPERVRTFFGVDGRRAALQDRLDPRARRRRARDLRVRAAASRRPPIPWNRVGLTHFSFNVRNTQKWHDHLKAKGVECVSTPERSPRGHSFFFVRGFRRQPDRADGPRADVLRPRLARTARGLAVSPRDVQAVLPAEPTGVVAARRIAGYELVYR